MVPPAALSVHLCIGQVYAFSVFNEPLTRVIGISRSSPEDWKLTTLGWVFSLAILFLGLSAAFGGKWLEKVGPRLTMFIAACCFGGGFLISALGVSLHQIWLIYLGYGVIGGIGLGLGYVSPVSTLIKWFPDRRGMATGMAIMGFGGGAMIGAPLSVWLMDHFKSATSVGVMETFLVMGTLYFLSMCVGSLIIRTPPKNWRPAGWAAPAVRNGMITQNHVHIDQALKTPQFYLLWLVLCLNVTAGIGVLGQASVMIQEMFQGVVTAAAAAGFVGLLSVFNMGGRFFWSTASDFVGRKNTYFIFFVLGIAFYASVPSIGAAGNLVLFIALYAVILSMYGGGFSTIPAYLADIFGTKFVGGIHGRLLTAWATAGVLGPVLVNYIREFQVEQGVAKADAYNLTMYVMAGLLFLGFCCNLMMRSVHEKHHMKHAELDEPDGVFPREEAASAGPDSDQKAVGKKFEDEIAHSTAVKPLSLLWLMLFWLYVTVPLAWGIGSTLQKASALFN
ncbi:L-lactate MFS transporter [Methylohalobius crimeensis]|uniref:L-lactate MFS transporter n=1 Tax=Methylohalobius crimeensis TaxID=244365 RepID=UPI000A02AE0D|nr:OFA family MFS transporter [Methylohalobius crimeensis]